MYLSEGKGKPVRTCLACGEKIRQERLLRFAAGQDGLVMLDAKGRLAGPGVYCCPNYRCLAVFVKKSGKILRALRKTKIDCSAIFSLVEKYRLAKGDCSN